MSTPFQFHADSAGPSSELEEKKEHLVASAVAQPVGNFFGAQVNPSTIHESKTFRVTPQVPVTKPVPELNIAPVQVNETPLWFGHGGDSGHGNDLFSTMGTTVTKPPTMVTNPQPSSSFAFPENNSAPQTQFFSGTDNKEESSFIGDETFERLSIASASVEQQQNKMLNCSRCGNLNGTAARFCNRCGLLLVNASFSPMPLAMFSNPSISGDQLTLGNSDTFFENTLAPTQPIQENIGYNQEYSNNNATEAQPMPENIGYNQGYSATVPQQTSEFHHFAQPIPENVGYNQKYYHSIPQQQQPESHPSAHPISENVGYNQEYSNSAPQPFEFTPSMPAVPEQEQISYQEFQQSVPQVYQPMHQEVVSATVPLRRSDTMDSGATQQYSQAQSSFMVQPSVTQSTSHVGFAPSAPLVSFAIHPRQPSISTGRVSLQQAALFSAQQQQPYQSTDEMQSSAYVGEPVVPSSVPVSPKTSNQRVYPVFCFGFGGQIFASFPVKQMRFSAIPNSVGTVSFRPGPMYRMSIGGIPEIHERFVAPILKSLNGLPLSDKSVKAKEVEELLSSWLAEASSTRDQSKILIQLLILMNKHKGSLINSSEEIINQILIPQFSEKNIMDILASPIPASVTSVGVTSEIMKMMVKGDRANAVMLAVSNQLWGHALMIASHVDSDTYLSTVSEFARQALPLGHPLRTMYLLFAGHNDLLGSELHQLGGNIASYWMWNVAIILSNRTNDDYLAITALGDSLMQNGFVSAAHVCYLLSDDFSLISGFDAPSSRVVFLGNDHKRNPDSFFRDWNSLRRTELLEYALRQTGDGRFCIAHLQVYKLLHASWLAEIGLTNSALKYCESIKETLRNYQGPSPYISKHLQRHLHVLHDRLCVNLGVPMSSSLVSGGDGSWLPKMGGLLEAFDRGLTRVMGVGDEGSSNLNASGPTIHDVKAELTPKRVSIQAESPMHPASFAPSINNAQSFASAPEDPRTSYSHAPSVTSGEHPTLSVQSQPPPFNTEPLSNQFGSFGHAQQHQMTENNHQNQQQFWAPPPLQSPAPPLPSIPEHLNLHGMPPSEMQSFFNPMQQKMPQQMNPQYQQGYNPQDNFSHQLPPSAQMPEPVTMWNQQSPNMLQNRSDVPVSLPQQTEPLTMNQPPQPPMMMPMMPQMPSLAPPHPQQQYTQQVVPMMHQEGNNMVAQSPPQQTFNQESKPVSMMPSMSPQPMNPMIPSPRMDQPMQTTSTLNLSQQYQPVPPRDEALEDLGFGNMSISGKGQTGQPAKDQEKPVEQTKDKGEGTPQKKGVLGFFSGLLGKKSTEAVPVAKEANLGQPSTFYYDEKLGRWVDSNDPSTMVPATPPPPPPSSMSASLNSIGPISSNNADPAAFRRGNTRSARSRYIDPLNPNGEGEDSTPAQVPLPLPAGIPTPNPLIPMMPQMENTNSSAPQQSSMPHPVQYEQQQHPPQPNQQWQNQFGASQTQQQQQPPAPFNPGQSPNYNQGNPLMQQQRPPYQPHQPPVPLNSAGHSNQGNFMMQQEPPQQQSPQQGYYQGMQGQPQYYQNAPPPPGPMQPPQQPPQQQHYQQQQNYTYGNQG